MQLFTISFKLWTIFRHSAGIPEVPLLVLPPPPPLAPMLFHYVRVPLPLAGRRFRSDKPSKRAGLLRLPLGFRRVNKKIYLSKYCKRLSLESGSAFCYASKTLSLSISPFFLSRQIYYYFSFLFFSPITITIIIIPTKNKRTNIVIIVYFILCIIKLIIIKTHTYV